MKKMTIVMQMVLALGLSTVAWANDPTPAPACPLVRTCQSPQLNPLVESTRGYVVEFKTAQEGPTMAVLEELVYSKEDKTRTYRELARLRCTDLTAQVESNTDETHLVTICRDPEIIDAGFVIELLSPDSKGVQSAILFEEGFLGRQQTDVLRCDL